MQYERLDSFVDKLNTALSRLIPSKYLELSYIQGESVFELALANKGTKVQDRGSDYSFIFYIEDGLITLKKLSFEVDYRFQDVSFQSDFELEAKLLGIVYSIVFLYEESSIYDYLSIFTNSTIEVPQDWFKILLGINGIPYVLKGLNEFEFENHTVYVSENSVSLISSDGRNDNFTISSDEDVIYVTVYVFQYLCDTYEVEDPKLYSSDTEASLPDEDAETEDDESNTTSGEELGPNEGLGGEGKAEMQGEGGKAQAPETPTEAGPALGEGRFTQP